MKADSSWTQVYIKEKFHKVKVLDSSKFSRNITIRVTDI